MLDSHTMASRPQGLALDSSDVLWGAFFAGGPNYHVGTIDPTTGGITYLPGFFSALTGVFGLAFNDTDTLFLLDGDSIRSVDTTTGDISGTWSNCDVGVTAGLGFGPDGNAWTTAATQLQEVPQSGCGTFGGSVPGGSGLDQIKEMANSGGTFYGVEWLGDFALSARLVSFDGTAFTSTPSLTTLGNLPDGAYAIAVPHTAIASTPEPSALWLGLSGAGFLLAAKLARRQKK